MMLPIGCCCVIVYFSAIVFREFIPLIVPHIVAKFIPEKVKHAWHRLMKWLSEKYPTSETAPIVPKECSSQHCAERKESINTPLETTSFIVKPEASVRKSVKTYQTPAFLKTSTKDGFACET